jgi:hypothetical protein
VRYYPSSTNQRQRSRDLAEKEGSFRAMETRKRGRKEGRKEGRKDWKKGRQIV